MPAVAISSNPRALQQVPPPEEVGGAGDAAGNAEGVSGWFQRAKQRAVVLLANPEVQFAWGF